MRSHHFILGCLLVAAPAFAQGRVPPQVSQASSRAVQRLRQVEASLDNVLQSRRVTPATAETDSLMTGAAEDMRASFTAALADLDRFAKSRGTTGGLDGMREFEKSTKEFQTQLDQVFEKEGLVAAQISEGDVLLDAALVQRMSRQDRREFRASISPRADSSYRKLLPKLWSLESEPTHKVASSSPTCPFSPSKFSVAIARSLDRRSFAERALELLVPSAGASEVNPIAAPTAGLGLGCVGACSGGVGFGCLICIASAGPAAVNAYNKYRDCSSGCGSCRWWKPWNCLCKARCVASFVATLA